MRPYIRAQVISLPEYIGNIMTLCLGKRGILVNQSYLTTTRVELNFEMPLTEIVFDFYDKLKSQTRGYASFDYSPIGYRDADIVKMDILLNGDKVDALSALIHRSRAQDFGRKLCEKTEGAFAKTTIPDSHTGCHRCENHCPRNHQRL
jgi:GTP-binding protein LepA